MLRNRATLLIVVAVQTHIIRTVKISPLEPAVTV
jgi:hypothetical protein